MCMCTQHCLTVHLLACSLAKLLAAPVAQRSGLRSALHVVLQPEAKMLSSGVWEQVLEQWREVILRQHWTDDYKIVVHGGDGRALDVNRYVSP